MNPFRYFLLTSIFYFDMQDGRGDHLVSASPNDVYPVFMRERMLFASERDGLQGNRLLIVDKYNSGDEPHVIGSDILKLELTARWPAFSDATGLIAYAGCLGGNCGIWTTGGRGYAQVEACCQIANGARLVTRWQMARV